MDKINLLWVRRFIPVTAVAIGVHYNSQLIDEVIGVAKATFAPEAKLANRAITDDSSSEAEVKKASNNDAQKDTEKTEENSDTEETSSKKDSDK